MNERERVALHKGLRAGTVMAQQGITHPDQVSLDMEQAILVELGINPDSELFEQHMFNVGMQQGLEGQVYCSLCTNIDFPDHICA